MLVVGRGQGRLAGAEARSGGVEPRPRQGGRGGECQLVGGAWASKDRICEEAGSGAESEWDVSRGSEEDEK